MRLHEDPDGIKYNGVKVAWAQHDASTFIYYVQSELLFISKSGTFGSKSRVVHSDLIDLFGKIGRIFVEESMYAYDSETGEYGEEPLPIKTPDDFNQHCEMVGHDIYWDETGGWIRWGTRSVQIYGDTDKAIEYLKKQTGKVWDNTGAFRQKYSSVGVMGRYWEDTEILGFWLTKRDLGRLLSKGGLDGLFEYLGLDKQNVRITTVNNNDGLISVRDALEAVGVEPTMTRDQERELMMKQHIDPDSKRKLNKGAEQIDKYGGVLPAQYHAWSRTSDGIIRLGDLLKESPDGVRGDDGKIKRHTYWYSDDAYAFFAFPMCRFIKRGDMHSDIWKCLLQCYRQQSLDPMISPQNDDYVGIKFDVERSAVLELLRPDGYLGKLMQRDLDGKIDDYRVEIPDALAGRLWENSKIIAFWNEQRNVLKNWSNVQSMFTKFFGSIYDYTVDWIERDVDVGSGKSPREMTPASDVGSGTFRGNKSPDAMVVQNDPKKDPKDDGGQLNFLSKVFQQPELLDRVDDKLLKKIQQKLHVLDPNVKAQVMKAVGNVTPNKAVQIANKLGMSVAEFNYIMNVNESSIQLTSLIPGR